MLARGVLIIQVQIQYCHYFITDKAGEVIFVMFLITEITNICHVQSRLRGCANMLRVTYTNLPQQIVENP